MLQEPGGDQVVCVTRRTVTQAEEPKRRQDSQFTGTNYL
jgi:hypothetical protein